MGFNRIRDMPPELREFNIQIAKHALTFRGKPGYTAPYWEERFNAIQAQLDEVEGNDDPTTNRFRLLELD